MRELKEFHLWDLSGSIYVLLDDDFRDNLFRELYLKFSSRRQYALNMSVDPSDVRRYHQGFFVKHSKKIIQYVPNWLIKKSLIFLSEKTKNELEKNIVALRSRAGSDLSNPRLPLKESPAVYRIIAHMIGDGSAGKGKTPYYANTCKELREEFKQDLLSLGKMNIYERIPNTTPVVYFPKVVTDILSFVFNVKFTYPERLPELLFSASDDCKKVFVRALFDDEGTVSTNLGICIHSEKILSELKSVLSVLGIVAGKVTASPYQTRKGNRTKLSINILKEDINKFSTNIGFSHPQKRRNLNFVLETIARNKIQRTRPRLLIENQILDLLKEKPRTTLELAHTLLFSVSGVYDYLNRLEYEHKIIKSGFKNKVIWNLV